MIRPNELALAGFNTVYAATAKRAVWQYVVEGNTRTKAPRLKVILNENGGFMCGVYGCSHGIINTTDYNLSRFAQLLRGLKHDNYAEMVEKYMEQAAEAAALADIEREDG